MLIHLKDENYDDLIKEGLVLVDFYATWCGPCKMLSPILDDISNELNVKVIKIDTDLHLDIARSFGIMTIPTLYIYKDGVKVDEIVGFIPKDDLLNKLNNY